jgi:hypothetical protein
MDFQYISLGHDCSTAAVLKDSGLRNAAFPFDWAETSFKALCACIEDNFKQFHQNVQLNSTKQRVIDTYGIQYPHDYPNIISSNYSNIDNNFYAEHKICDDYEKYTDQVLEKYGRRIERFRNAMDDRAKPIIFLFRGFYAHALEIKKIIERVYNRENVIVVVGTKEVISLAQINTNPAIVVCYPEENEKWNELSVWTKAIDIAKQRYPYLMAQPKTTIKRFGLSY